MVERISTATRYAQLVADMRINQYNFDRLTAQLSSGRKLTSIKDDPIAAVNYVNTARQLGRVETFEQNVNMATTELSALDDFMELARGYLQQAWNKAVQANNQTYNGDSLRALKTEIDEITKTMVDLGNSEYDDNYIFAGANTKLVPFKMDENGNIRYYGTPHDNPDYIRQTEVADGVYEVINTTGDKIFGYYYKEEVTKDPNGVEVTLVPAHDEYQYTNGTAYTGDPADLVNAFADDFGDIVKYNDEDGKYYYIGGAEYTADPDALTPILVDGENQKVNLVNVPDKYYYEDGTECTEEVTTTTEEHSSGVLGALRQLSNAIQTVLDGDTANGYEQMNATLDMFSDAHNTILNEQTKFGGVYNRMEMSSSTLETTGDSLTTLLSDINSLDYASAISQWMNAQYAYQASLQVAASSMNMSLLNYM